MALPPIFAKPLSFIKELPSLLWKAEKQAPQVIGEQAVRGYKTGSEYVEKYPCPITAVTISPIAGIACKYFQKSPIKEDKTEESVKPDTSKAGTFLREQIRAQQSTVPELEKVICVGSTIVDGQELTVPVDLRIEGTEDPLGECVNSNGYKSKKLGYVSPADLDEARRIHREEVEEAKRKITDEWTKEYDSFFSSQLNPRCSKIE